MTDRDESRPKKRFGERAREAFGDILEALEELVSPVPAPQPVRIRRPHYPRR